MTERELLAVVSAIVFEGSNDNAVDAVRRASAILRRVEEVVGHTSPMPPPTPAPLTYPETGQNATPVEHEEHEATHAKGKRAK